MDGIVICFIFAGQIFSMLFLLIIFSMIVVLLLLIRCLHRTINIYLTLNIFNSHKPMDLKIPDSWQGDIFCDHAQQFKDNAINVHLESGATNHIHQGYQPMQVKSGSEAFERVILAMVKSRQLSEKNDFGIIYKLDVEMHVMGFKQYRALADYLATMSDLPPALCAQSHSVGYYSFGHGIYPDWLFDGSLDDAAQSHIHSVACEYIRQMGQLGFLHPHYQAMIMRSEE